jgi:hypothetical protein
LLFGQGIKIGIGLCVSRIDLIKARQRIDRLGESLFDVTSDIFVWIELGFLCEVPDLNTCLRPRLSLNIGIDARHNLE